GGAHRAVRRLAADGDDPDDVRGRGGEQRRVGRHAPRILTLLALQEPAPGFVEDGAKLACGGAGDLDDVVAPALAALFALRPRAADIQAAGEPDLRVAYEDLAVIAPHPTRDHSTPEAEQRVEDADVAPGGA